MTQPATINQPITGDSLVFVYGSLRSGLGNHRCMGDAAFISTAIITPEPGQEFRMVSLGAFPALIDTDSETATPATGEVYRATPEVMENLDSWEGIAHGLYERRRCIVTLEDQNLLLRRPRAYVYILAADCTGIADSVEGGDWLRYLAEQRKPATRWQDDLARWGAMFEGSEVL